MDQSGLRLTGAVFLASSLLLALFTAMRVWRNRSLKSILLLLVDFTVVSILPLTMINWISSGFGAIDRLLLAGFLFYLTTCVCCLLFPSTCERYLLPAASLYLVFGTLQSFLTFLDNSSFEFQLATFIYRLMDNITVATLCELFIAELAPTYKRVGSMLNALLSYRTFNNVNRNVRVARSSDPVPFPSQARKYESSDSADRFLKTALNFFRERKYKSCVESCDAGVENAVVATLLQLYPTRLEAPMTIEEQLSKLKSKGIPFRGERIIRLRRLRNSLTVSCRDGTPDQAKWAVRVLRMTLKTIEDFGKTTSGSVDRK